MSAAGRRGTWPLAALTVAVLLVHLGLLGRSKLALTSGQAQPLRTRAFSTRTIAVPAPPTARPETARPVPAPAAPARVLRRSRTPAVAPEPGPSIPVAGQEAAVPGVEPAIDVSTTGPAAALEPAMEEPAAPAAPAVPVPSAGAASASEAPAASAALAGVTLSARVAPPVRLRYDVAGQVRRLSYSAGAELLWRHDGYHYDARLEVSAFLVGSRTQTSEGTLTPEGLAPRRFSDKARTEVAAHFDWVTQRVSFSANTPAQPLLPGAQDRLSLSLQLGALLAAEPARLPPGDSLTLQIIGPRDAEPWVITAENEERLTLPFGEVVARKFVRAPRREHDARLELWLAPALDFLPVRVRLTQGNGDFVEQLLRARESADTAASGPRIPPTERAN